MPSTYIYYKDAVCISITKEERLVGGIEITNVLQHRLKWLPAFMDRKRGSHNLYAAMYSYRTSRLQSVLLLRLC